MISEAGSPSLKKGKEAMTEPTIETLARRLDHRKGHAMRNAPARKCLMCQQLTESWIVCRCCLYLYCMKCLDTHKQERKEGTP